MLNEIIRKLDKRLLDMQGTCRVVRFDHVWTALAGNAMMGICCDDQENLLNHPDFSPDW